MNTAAFIVCLHLFSQIAAATARLVCYFSNMSRYRTGVGKYHPGNIDPLLCTHLVYSFAIINHESELSESEWNEENVYRSFTQLKNRNSRLKTLLSVREDEDGAQFSTMLSSPEHRHRFIQSSMMFLRTHKFDGLDLEWERSGSEDIHMFSQLCKGLSEAFKAEHDGDNQLILSAAVSAHAHASDTYVDLTEISKYLDFLSVKTFDLVDDEDKVTAHHSPLYSNNTNNIDAAITWWLQRGFPAEKLLLGFSTHARSFTLSSKDEGVGAPISGPASPGPFTQQSGVWAYYETCSFLRGTSSQWVQDQKVPFAVKGSQWVGFDNQWSYDAKVDYLRSKQLTGAAVWTLDMDDFTGSFCDKGRYALISHLKHKLTEGLTTQETPPSPPLQVSSSPSYGSTQTPPFSSSVPRPPSASPLTSSPSSSCSLNITVEFPVSRFCTHRADGVYLSSAHTHTVYRCVQRRTYVTKCHSEETQQENGGRERTVVSKAVVTISLTVIHVLGVWTVS